MGTRADFYVGRGESAEWLGSIAWDGYPSGLPVDIVRPADAAPMTEDEYRRSVGTFFAEREDATLPEHGWPWPWENSHTTDYSYAFDDGRVWASCYGHAWFDPTKEEPDHDDGKPTVFPDMTNRKNVTWGKRSGVMVFTVPK